MPTPKAGRDSVSPWASTLSAKLGAGGLASAGFSGARRSNPCKALGDVAGGGRGRLQPHTSRHELWCQLLHRTESFALVSEESTCFNMN